MGSSSGFSRGNIVILLLLLLLLDGKVLHHWHCFNPVAMGGGGLVVVVGGICGLSCPVNVFFFFFNVFCMVYHFLHKILLFSFQVFFTSIFKERC